MGRRLVNLLPVAQRTNALTNGVVDRPWVLGREEPRAGDTLTRYPLSSSGESVIGLSLGRRLVNLLPVAQRTNAFTNGVVDRPWVVGREFESHVHHENAF